MGEGFRLRLATTVAAVLVGVGPACAQARAPAVAGRAEPMKAEVRKLSAEEAQAALWKAGASATFAASTAAERTAIAEVVPLLVAAARSAGPLPPKASALAQTAGFAIERWQIAADLYLALLELPDSRRGAGAYVFRVEPKAATRELILEAPHAFFDEGTDSLSAALFFGPGPKRPRALFTNSVHRYQAEPGRKKREGSVSDVAHNPEHLFTVATISAATALAPADVVQLHGFGSGDRQGLPAGTIAVVSSGQKAAASPQSTRVAGALKKEFGDAVRLYPTEASALGGTTNAQRKALTSGGFLHLELSAELRKRLLSEAPARSAFARIVLDPGEDH